MQITFLQTADADVYAPMLALTSETVKRYCDLHGHRYQQFVGVKRGCRPWHATYNRLFLLRELWEQQHKGWVFYMDADALISDMSFDLRAWLADKHHLAAIFSGYCDGERPQTVNAGGFAVNFGHPMADRLVNDYWYTGHIITDEQWAAAEVWGETIADDQNLLCCILDAYDKEGLSDAFLYEQANYGITNHGPFIKQRLRSKYSSFAERMAAIDAEVRDILKADQARQAA